MTSFDGAYTASGKAIISLRIVSMLEGRSKELEHDILNVPVSHRKQLH